MNYRFANPKNDQTPNPDQHHPFKSLEFADHLMDFHLKTPVGDLKPLQASTMVVRQSPKLRKLIADEHFIGKIPQY